MLTLRKGDPDEKGVWFDCKPKDFDYHKAFITCPDCNMAISLRGRKITEDGIVLSSVICPQNHCRFNKYVQLEGWDKGSVERGEI